MYGIPAPLLNVQVTNWGRGIAELARLFYQFGGRYHLSAFLGAWRQVLLAPGERFRINEAVVTRGAPRELAGLIRVLQGDAQREALGTRQELRELAGLQREADDAPIDAPGGQPTPPVDGEFVTVSAADLRSALDLEDGQALDVWLANSGVARSAVAGVR